MQGGDTMKKAVFLFLAVMVVMGFAVKDSVAAAWCWQIDPFDNIKLTVVKPDPASPFWSLHGVWRGGDTIIPLAGTMAKTLDGTGRILTLHGTYPGSNSQSYSINVEIDAATRNGTMHIYYIPLNSYLDFPLTKIPCSDFPK